jgi:hypothetical protein
MWSGVVLLTCVKPLKINKAKGRSHNPIIPEGTEKKLGPDKKDSKRKEGIYYK